MSQFESQSPVIGSSRRASSFPNIPRIGVNESLATPGIAVSNPSSSGVLLAQELNNAITGIASVVSDLGNNAARQRQLTAAEEEKRQHKLKAAQDIIDAKDRSEATVHAQLDAEKVTHGLKMGLIQVNSDPAQFASQVIESNTQGMSPVYAEAYRNHVTLAITKSFNDRSEALYNDSLKATLDTLPSSILSMSNSGDVHKLVESYQKIDPNMPTEEIISHSIVPAMNVAAKAGRTDQTNMLANMLPDDKFGVEKQTALAELDTVLAKEKTAKVKRFHDDVLGYITNLNNNPAAALSIISKESKDLPGDVVHSLVQSVRSEITRRAELSKNSQKAASKELFTAIEQGTATSMFASGRGFLIENSTLPDGSVVTKSEKQKVAAGEIKRFNDIRYPNNPQAAFNETIHNFSTNGYKDPLIEARFSRTGNLISTTELSDEKGHAGKDIESDLAMYNQIKSVNPVYAKAIAGSQTSMDLEAINDVMKTKPGGGVIGAAKIVAENKRFNISVSLNSTERQRLIDDVDATVSPWGWGNDAHNKAEIESEALSLAHGWVARGSSASDAMAHAVKDIQANYKVINGRAVYINDIGMTPFIQSQLTNILNDRIEQITAKHPQDAEYIKSKQWTMDFNPDSRYLTIVGKDPWDTLPVFDPSLSVIPLDDAGAIAESLKLRGIIGKQDIYIQPARSQEHHDMQMDQERFLSDKFGTFNKYLK